MPEHGQLALPCHLTALLFKHGGPLLEAGGFEAEDGHLILRLGIGLISLFSGRKSVLNETKIQCHAASKNEYPCILALIPHSGQSTLICFSLRSLPHPHETGSSADGGLWSPFINLILVTHSPLLKNIRPCLLTLSRHQNALAI